MLRRSHRRRPPVPVPVAAVLLVLAAAAVVTAGIFQDRWILRGSVAALAFLLLAGGLLMRRAWRMLRGAQVQAAGTSSALARAETRASRELLRRDREIARLNGELGIAWARLAEVTGASLYAAAVLAELLRNSPLLSETAGDRPGPDEEGGTAESDEQAAQDSPAQAASSTVVQVWPSIDDAPTVVDLLRWDQVRRMTDEPVVGNPTSGVAS